MEREEEEKRRIKKKTPNTFISLFFHGSELPKYKKLTH